MTDEAIRALPLKRGSIKTSSTAFEKAIHKLSEECDDFNVDRMVILELEQRLSKLDELASDFDKIQTDIENMSAEEQLEDHYGERPEFDDRYFAIGARVTRLISGGSSAKITASHNSTMASEHSQAKNGVTSDASNNIINNQGHTPINNNIGTPPQQPHVNVNEDLRTSPENAITTNRDSIRVRLPTIQLLVFNGAYEQWSSFPETFNAWIQENTNLSTIQKLYYLRSSLGTEPLRIN